MSSERQQEPAGARSEEGGMISRRRLLQGAGGVGMGVIGGSLLAACGSSGSSGGSANASTAPGKPKSGGHATFALGAGTDTDVPDPEYPGAAADSLLVEVVWDQLTQVNNDMQLEMWLAESVEPNKDLTEWTIRLRPDILFQDGTPCTADDVLFTLKRILNPKNAFYGLSQIGPVDPKSLRKLDKLTVRVGMTRPFSVFDYALGDGGVMGIVPVGFSRKKPIGTGAFRITEFNPTQVVQLERNPHYWQNSKQPYLDSITCQMISDDSARVNALLTGQVDAISLVPPAQVPVIKSHSNLEMLISRTSANNFYGMNVQYAPFNDVRVRQALKYAVDRPQVLQDAFSGYGTLGYDVFSPFDPDSDRSLVRTRDVEKSKFLLKQAGHLGAKVQCVVGETGAGVVQAATVMAENANQAGFDMTVRTIDPGAVFGKNFLHWPFSTDGLPGLTYLTSASLSDITGGGINIGHWADKRYTSLYYQATAERDPAKRRDIIHEMQRIEFNDGVNLIFTFPDTLDAHSTRIQGWPKQDLTGMGLGRGRWDQLYLA